jgi:hypothetical protein
MIMSLLSRSLSCRYRRQVLEIVVHHSAFKKQNPLSESARTKRTNSAFPDMFNYF